MIPAAFAYHRPTSIEETLALLVEYDGEAKLLAGGHSLLPMMKLRLARPEALIDISRVPGLTGIHCTEHACHIGAMTLHRSIAESVHLKALAPVLSEAAGHLGDVQVRNRGTIGGSCAHGDPAADYPAVMLALGATFSVQGPNGMRNIAVDEFFLGMFTTGLEPNELLTAVAFEPAPNSAYVKFPHPASGYAIVAAAVTLQVQHERIVSARVAVTGVADAHARLPAVEARLPGIAVRDTHRIAEACSDSAAGLNGSGDAFASAPYRSAIADTIVERAVRAALQAD